MLWIIDRIENGVAVIETPEGMVNINLNFLPEGVSEGDVISLELSKTEIEKRRERIKGKMNSLFKD